MKTYSKGGYRKPVRTGKPGPADVLPSRVRGLTVAKLMEQWNTEQLTSNGRQKQMLYDVTVTLHNAEEGAMFAEFAAKISASRNLSPFDFTLSHTPPTAAKIAFDEAVPVDEPPAATSGPTWATPPNASHPSEDDAKDALRAMVTRTGLPSCQKLLEKFKVSKVKEIAPESRASFIAEAAIAS